MGMTYTIRPVETDDIESISAVATKSWHHTYGSIYSQETIRQFVERSYSWNNLSGAIERDSARGQRLFHVALDADGIVVAFSHVVPYDDEAERFGVISKRVVQAMRLALPNPPEKIYSMLFAESAHCPHIHFHIVPRLYTHPIEFRGSQIFDFNGPAVGIEVVEEFVTAMRDRLAE
ncbi:hypothetical protein JZ785_00630 [Alicyclobacillus curvatus]|nr:hypothetical protein JZ785_00630 [Alicyclobacillus curvatus]